MGEKAQGVTGKLLEPIGVPQMQRPVEREGDLELDRQAEAVRTLIGLGARLEDRDSKGMTALHLAASEGNANVVRALLKAGAKADVEDEDGRRPLHRAAEKGHKTVVRLLLEAGAELEAEDIYAERALQLAVERGREGIARLLVEGGTNVDASSGSEEQSPLSLANEHTALRSEE